MSLKTEKWESLTSVPLTVFSFVYIALYSIEVLVDARGALRNSIEIASDVVWGIFWIDFLVRLFGSKLKLQFLKANLLEFASLILPAIRALRMLRVVTAMSQSAQLLKSPAARVNYFLAVSAPLLFYMCALGILDVERHAPGASITSFKLAVWWSMTTLATVGYGDLFPVTDSGRLIAAILMFSGIGLMSVITANVAGWFIRNVGQRTKGTPE